jgi:hypothetical protein
VAATSAVTPVNATTFTAPATTGQRSVSSASAADAAAGTGAQTIVLTYLDSSFVQHTETIALNGTTPVNTVGTDVFYIESMVVATVGSGGQNAGVISLFTQVAGGGTAIGTIKAGDNQTMWAHHYVAANQSCYILKFVGGATGAVGFTWILAQDLSVAGKPLIQIGLSLVHLAGSSEEHQFSVPLTVKGPAYIQMNEFPTTAVAGNIVQAGFEYVQG